MTESRRRVITTPGERDDPARRGPASIVASVAIHLVAFIAVLQIVIAPLTLGKFDRRPAPPVETHVEYMRSAADTGARQRAGGDNRRATNTPARLRPPAEVPTALPPTPAKSGEAAAPQPEGGTGPVIGGGGPTRGVTPAFIDPRLWAPTDPAPVRPKSATERLDSAIATRVHHLQDSLRALGVQRAPGDWTWNGKDGKKYGIDQSLIHLGNFSIPTALLALLPLNVQGNPSTYANAKRIGMIRGEILEQSAREARDAQFYEAVKELRERKQKERADKAKADATIPEAPPPVKIVP